MSALRSLLYNLAVYRRSESDPLRAICADHKREPPNVQSIQRNAIHHTIICTCPNSLRYVCRARGFTLFFADARSKVQALMA
ncbi:hypothetical protein EVAR_31402_1 [Eumeta japonica]|uniref:Uncharacterized protein n=1 Tax=Eumeta variegata TaxID=151549 RepID=A0A4C1UXU1_EUMVA|nr:hypothetical protein EVAR_31402_1 [Eumeta japonica]